MEGKTDCFGVQKNNGKETIKIHSMEQMQELVFKTKKGTPVTTSKLVAQIFTKRHSDVLRAIEKLECSQDFHKRNFALVFKDKQLPNNATRKDKCYVLTKDGFSFLVMGFTGKEAGKFKEDFINAFNKMAEQKSVNLPTKKELAQMVIDSENAKELAEKKLAENQALLVETKNHVEKIMPMVEFASTIARTRNEEIMVGEYAKLLNIKNFGQNKMFQFLRENKVFMEKSTLPYQKYLNAGYFKVREKIIERTNGKQEPHLYATITGVPAGGVST